MRVLTGKMDRIARAYTALGKTGSAEVVSPACKEAKPD